MAYEGGCFCGAVRYRATGQPLHVVHCHCTMCRRASGAPFVTWAVFDAATVSFVQGQPTEFASSAKGVRGFCDKCGSPLTFRERDRGAEIDLAVGTMDDAGALVPERHIFTSSKLDWIHLDDGLPRYPGETAEGPD